MGWGLGCRMQAPSDVAAAVYLGACLRDVVQVVDAVPLGRRDPVSHATSLSLSLSFFLIDYVCLSLFLSIHLSL